MFKFPLTAVHLVRLLGLRTVVFLLLLLFHICNEYHVYIISPFSLQPFLCPPPPTLSQISLFPEGVPIPEDAIHSDMDMTPTGAEPGGFSGELAFTVTEGAMKGTEGGRQSITIPSCDIDEPQ